VLVAVLGAMVCLAVLAAVGLTRSLTELSAASRFIGAQQALARAEGGIDLATAQLREVGLLELNDLIGTSGACAIEGCAYRFSDNEEADGDPTQDMDRILVMTGEGASGGVQRRVTVMIRVAAGIFAYGVMANRLSMCEGASIGTAEVPTPIRLYNWLDAELTNTIYAGQIEFIVPDPTCPDCFPVPDPMIFPLSPTLVTGSQINEDLGTAINFNPYYERAIAECVAEDPSDTARQAKCEDGSANSSHHITADTELDGSGVPIQIDGVVYVEKDANLDFQGQVTVRGTIVHEGWDDRTYDPNHPYARGRIKLKPGAAVTVDSYAGATPLAPGVAVFGQAALVAGDSDISLSAKGLVMVGGDADGGFQNGSVLGGDSVIEGNLVVVCDDPFQHIDLNVNGPGTDQPAIIVPNDGASSAIHSITLTGNAKVIYVPPAVRPPGIQLGSSSQGAMVFLKAE